MPLTASGWKGGSSGGVAGFVTISANGAGLAKAGWLHGFSPKERNDPLARK